MSSAEQKRIISSLFMHLNPLSMRETDDLLMQTSLEKSPNEPYFSMIRPLSLLLSNVNSVIFVSFQVVFSHPTSILSQKL